MTLETFKSELLTHGVVVKASSPGLIKGETTLTIHPEGQDSYNDKWLAVVRPGLCGVLSVTITRYGSSLDYGYLYGDAWGNDVSRLARAVKSAL